MRVWWVVHHAPNISGAVMVILGGVLALGCGSVPAAATAEFRAITNGAVNGATPASPQPALTTTTTTTTEPGRQLNRRVEIMVVS